MKQLNSTTLLLTRQEAYTLLCPQADGCSDYLLEGMEITCLSKSLDRDRVDWSDIMDEMPTAYHSFQMNFDDEGTLEEQLPYIEGHLKQYNIIKPQSKKLRTRLGDIFWQECLEYLRDCGMASNKYGLPRPGMLDLTFCNVWIKAPRGYEAHYDYDYRVIAVIQPNSQLLIRKYKVLKEYKHGERNEATDDYRLVDIKDLDIYGLVDLVDDIKQETLNFRPVWQTGFATEVNQFLDILKENRKYFDFKKGDEVCIQSWLCQGGDEYKRDKPYLTTIIDINDHRVIYNDPDGCGWIDGLCSLVPVKSPWISYIGCQKQYEWQEEEEEEKYK